MGWPALLAPDQERVSGKTFADRAADGQIRLSFGQPYCPFISSVRSLRALTGRPHDNSACVGRGSCRLTFPYPEAAMNTPAGNPPSPQEGYIEVTSSKSIKNPSASLYLHGSKGGLCAIENSVGNAVQSPRCHFATLCRILCCTSIMRYLSIIAGALAATVLAAPIPNPVAAPIPQPSPVRRTLRMYFLTLTQEQPGIPSSSTARSYLSSLTVQAQGSQAGYDRSKFPHWITQSGSCDTREVALKVRCQSSSLSHS